MKEGSKVFSCVYVCVWVCPCVSGCVWVCPCVSVCVWMLGGCGFDSVVSEFLPRWEMSSSCHFTYCTLDSSWERRTWTALLSRYINVQSLRRLSVPILVCARGTVKGVWDHFRLLDVLLCYCASEITWRYIFHTRFSSFAQKSPEGIEEFMSGTLLYVGRRKILFLIYINIFSAVKFAVVL